MKLSGLHILLTYQCTFECDHCFVWGSPFQSGTLTLARLREIFQQAKAAGVGSIYFEGGEPFLYYPTLVKGVQAAREMGFSVGIVSNAYWATSREDAEAALAPLAGQIEDLSVSSDLFHYSELISRQAKDAEEAAADLGIPVGTITIARPEDAEAEAGKGQIPEGGSGVMYRGRAARKLAPHVPLRPWDLFTACPHEDLRDPGRCHLDPLGNLHICQGISLGNLFETPLVEFCDAYDPDAHPICGPLLRGGPAALVTEYGLPHEAQYADACHLCYEARLALRERFPAILTPDQMYGVGL